MARPPGEISIFTIQRDVETHGEIGHTSALSRRPTNMLFQEDGRVPTSFVSLAMEDESYFEKGIASEEHKTAIMDAASMFYAGKSDQIIRYLWLIQVMCLQLGAKPLPPHLTS